MKQSLETVNLVESWGLPPLILFFNTSTGWFGSFVLSTIVNQNKEAWLQESKLAKMLCTGHRVFGTNRWKFLPKVNTLYFRLCNNCEFMMCILIVNHQFNRMHPWCSWECMLPGRCSPGKRCHLLE